jgi:hypothetical protein
MWIGMAVLGLVIAASAGLSGAEGSAAKPATPSVSPKKVTKAFEADSTKDTETERNEKALAREASAVELELQQLRELLESQAKQLQAQSEQLRQQQQKMQALENQLRTANAPRENFSTAGGTTETLNGGPKQEKQATESPIAIRYKGITLTPGGFMAAEAVWRQRALSADVNTPLNAIPFPGSSMSRVTEFNASGRQSRISMLAEGKLSSVKIGGYYEADFLSAGTTSNNNQSNSYTFRQRQFWGQAVLDSGWTFTGGQMWSLVTETRKGVQSRTEATPLTIDAQYTAGFSWARQFGFRVSKNLGDKLWLAFSVEGPQTTFGGRGFPNNFLIAAPGAGGGLFNATANYSFNETPDFIVKAAFEPGWGHYEVFGVFRVFRSRIFPNAPTSAAGAFNDTRSGGGIGANLRLPLLNKKLDVGVHFLGGDGINRYGTVGLPDATARTDGTLALIRGGQALGTLEWHATPMLDIYVNVGGEYAARTAYVNSSGGGVGYGSLLFNNSGCGTEALPTNQNNPGSPSSCAGDTRNIIEGTLGFWHRFYKGEKGTLQWGAQYSNVVRNTWSGTGGAPHGVENMVFTSFRYYLP